MLWKKTPKPEEMPASAANLSWEADLVLNLRNEANRGWFVAKAALALAGLLAVALVAAGPMRKVVPYVYVVDKLTGDATIASTVPDFVTTGVLNDKHWIMQFLVSRERYNYRLLQHDYDQVRRLAGDGPWSTYDKLFQGEAALDKRNGESIEVLPTVLSITLAEGGLATVRYELRTRDLRTLSEGSVSRRVATLRYKYEPKANLAESEAIKNPLGFTVVAYQTDPELVTGQEAMK